jgi:hypothetical protein
VKRRLFNASLQEPLELTRKSSLLLLIGIAFIIAGSLVLKQKTWDYTFQRLANQGPYGRDPQVSAPNLIVVCLLLGIGAVALTAGIIVIKKRPPRKPFDPQ